MENENAGTGGGDGADARGDLRAFVDRAASTASTVAERAAQAASTAASAGGRAAVAGGRAVRRGTGLAAQGAWAYDALTSVPPPGVPADRPWRISLGTLLGRHPRTPRLAHRALGLLDHLGAVRIGPEGAGFDGEEFAWSDVTEIRTRDAFEVMTTQALEHEVDRIREFLPPVPGRKWLVTKAAEAVATVVLAALERGSTDRPLDGRAVPVEIVHRGLLGRRKVHSGGLFAAATLVIVEQSAAALLATAEQHGVLVRPAAALGAAEPDRAARLAALRTRTSAMAAHLARLQELATPDREELEPAEPEGAERPGPDEAEHPEHPELPDQPDRPDRRTPAPPL